MRVSIPVSVSVLVLSLVASVASAAPPNLHNARLQTRSAEGGLEAAFRAAAGAQLGPAWIGYEVPLRGRHQMCCFRSVEGIDTTRCPGCRLEGEGAFTMNIGTQVRLEDAEQFLVLYRVEGGRVERIRALSKGCGIDVGGLPLHWLDGVRPAESLAFLGSHVATGLANGKRARWAKGGLDEPALAAISFHADPGADALLERFVAPGQALHVRKQAAFWMGNARGRRGFETLRRLVREDASPELREHAVFALTQSEEPEAVETIISVARGDVSGHVRGQALFWLGQKAGRKAAGAITRAIDEDPETEVKKKAVFALSQLPKDEGVPLLIDTARRNANPAVRKQAMFWLGQSEDPRALAFFEEVLR